MIGLINEYLYHKGAKLSPSNSESWKTDHPMMSEIPLIEAINSDGEAAPQNRNNHLMKTRLLPSSDDRTPCRTRTELMVKQATGLSRIPALSAMHSPLLLCFPFL
jgi:hypothetical protein